MSFIIAVLTLAGLLTYDALRLYTGVAAAYGVVVSSTAVLLAMALLAGAVVTFVRHCRAIRDVSVKGQ